MSKILKKLTKGQTQNKICILKIPWWKRMIKFRCQRKTRWFWRQILDKRISSKYLMNKMNKNGFLKKRKRVPHTKKNKKKKGQQKKQKRRKWSRINLIWWRKKKKIKKMMKMEAILKTQNLKFKVKSVCLRIIKQKIGSQNLKKITMLFQMMKFRGKDLWEVLEIRKITNKSKQLVGIVSQNLVKARKFILHKRKILRKLLKSCKLKPIIW